MDHLQKPLGSFGRFGWIGDTPLNMNWWYKDVQWLAGLFSRETEGVRDLQKCPGAKAVVFCSSLFRQPRLSAPPQTSENCRRVPHAARVRVSPKAAEFQDFCSLSGGEIDGEGLLEHQPASERAISLDYLLQDLQSAGAPGA